MNEPVWTGGTAWAPPLVAAPVRIETAVLACQRTHGVGPRAGGLDNGGAARNNEIPALSAGPPEGMNSPQLASRHGVECAGCHVRARPIVDCRLPEYFSNAESLRVKVAVAGTDTSRSGWIEGARTCIAVRHVGLGGPAAFPGASVVSIKERMKLASRLCFASRSICSRPHSGCSNPSCR